MRTEQARLASMYAQAGGTCSCAHDRTGYSKIQKFKNRVIAAVLTYCHNKNKAEGCVWTEHFKTRVLSHFRNGPRVKKM